jgi:tetratricopeptide (TPR) repeat protein
MSAPSLDNQAAEQLDSCRRAFNSAPSFGTLCKLAELWEGEQRWTLSAQAWLHVARARPHDARACARAAVALSRVAQHEQSTELWERACRLQPDNREYAAAYERALRHGRDTAQANDSLGRTEV